MKAAYIDQFGGPEVIKYGDLPDPSPGPGQVVVDVFAASVNGADWKVRANHYGRPAPFPLILGRDFSGVVSALGEGVTDLRVGDEVFGVLERAGKGPTPKRSRSRPPSSRRSRPRCRMSTPRPWRSPG